jgi:ApeA-like protein
VLEPFEHRGLWWLPEIPDRKVAGVLSFSQDEGAALELIGQLPRPHSDSDPESGEVTISAGLLPRERIVGVSADGKSFTLETCRATGWGLGGFITETFAPDVVLEGARYAEGEAVLFHELRVRYVREFGRD